MSEEKETIKYIESGIDTYIENTKVTKIVISEEQAKILLNLIEKQQKELEQEKEKNKELETEVVHWKGKYHLLSRKIDVVAKDKIKEKIKELENKVKDYQCNENVINVHQRYILEELLEG